MGRPKGRPNGPGQLSEPAFVQTHIKWVECTPLISFVILDAFDLKQFCLRIVGSTQFGENINERASELE